MDRTTRAAHSGPPEVLRGTRRRHPARRPTAHPAALPARGFCRKFWLNAMRAEEEEGGGEYFNLRLPRPRYGAAIPYLQT